MDSASSRKTQQEKHRGECKDDGARGRGVVSPAGTSRSERPASAVYAAANRNAQGEIEK